MSNKASKIRHVVSIAGVVQERSAQANGVVENHGKKVKPPPRIANAWVRILVHTAPAAFQSRVLAKLDALYADSFAIELADFVAQLDAGQLSEALQGQFATHGRLLSLDDASLAIQERGSTWHLVDAGKRYVIWHLLGKLHVYFNARQAGTALQPPRPAIDQTWSQADGIFYFLDLPASAPGEGYYLRISVPDMGTQYNSAEEGPIAVSANPEGQAVQTAWKEVALSPTCLKGKVTYQKNGNTYPLAGATVYLRGETISVLTHQDGQYELRYVTAGHAILEVVADSFVKFNQPLELVVGQTQEVNVQLQPKPPGP